MLGLVCGSAVPASGAVTYPAGGTWDSGADAKHVWSRYYHGSRTHSATTVGSSGTRGSGWVAKGRWATSAQWAKLSGNKAYYNYK